MASNNNNNKSTILLTHTQTDRPLSPAQSENTNTESATRRSCAFARQGQKLRPLMRREGQAGRQGAREGGRESSERGGSGDQWGPAEVGSQVSCPATIVLFVPCVRVCVRAILLSHELCPKFVTSTNTRVKCKQISVYSSKKFSFQIFTSEAELLRREQSSDTHPPTIFPMGIY